MPVYAPTPSSFIIFPMVTVPDRFGLYKVSPHHPVAMELRESLVGQMER